MPAVPICGPATFPAAGCGSSRIARSNYETELDNAVLLNYALGPKAQRLKHKDICESGSKGVVIPLPPICLYTQWKRYMIIPKASWI